MFSLHTLDFEDSYARNSRQVQCVGSPVFQLAAWWIPLQTDLKLSTITMQVRDSLTD